LNKGFPIHTGPTGFSQPKENRLIGATGYTYAYDGDGNRVRKSNGSTGTLYWYMAPGIVGESDLSGNLTDEYVFFDGERGRVQEHKWCFLLLLRSPENRFCRD